MANTAPPTPRSVRPHPRESKPWTVQDSTKLYQVEGWGSPYFAVNEFGNVTVAPNPDRDEVIDLHELVESIRLRGLDFPLLVRFPDILGHRIKVLNQAFESAITEYEYPGRFRGVYPVKVNQQRHLVEAVVEHGRDWQFGLEAGSKAELLICLSVIQEDGGFIVCNGYKDLSYMETAFVAQQFDKTVIVVLERFEELQLALDAAAHLGVRPILGVRAKLSAKGVGRWKDSAGETAKFGLTKSEVVKVVDTLAERKMLDCLQLLHFHIGSQVSSIMPINAAVREAASIYVELSRMGCAMGYLDVGGGLAIDYDGSKSDFHASRNYTLEEYAADVVTGIQDPCVKANVTVPTIVTESGRATVAHQSILLFDVVGVGGVRDRSAPPAPEPGAHRVLTDLYDTLSKVRAKNVQESFHDANQLKEEAQNLFKYGYLGLRELARAEKLHGSCCEKIIDTTARLRFVPEELQELAESRSSIYYCNFSVFQSAPDTWAIDQLFPVMPIHRLSEEPTVPTTLADLTCDSDGMIDHFIDVEDVAGTLKLHQLVSDETYVLGMFLNGAYQEILGDLHNLFGDTNAVHVRLTEAGYSIDHVIKGDKMSQVLQYVQYVPSNMTESVRRQAERALSRGRITLDQMRTLLDHYEKALSGYTYLSSERPLT